MIVIKRYTAPVVLLLLMTACGTHSHMQLRGLGEAGVPGAGTAGTLAGAVTLPQAAHNAITGRDREEAKNNSESLNECMKDYIYLDNDDTEKHEAINKCLQEVRRSK